MTPMIKICGINDSESIHAAIQAGADAIGFVFYEHSPRNLTLDKAVRLAADMPNNVIKVAVMMHPSVTHWEGVQKRFRPDAVQTDMEDFSYLKVKAGIEKWPVLREGSVLECCPEKFVYEGKTSGQGKVVDWKIAGEFAKRGQMILAGGLSATNVREAIQLVSPFGVDVSSAVESRPGIKDTHKIRAFISEVKTVQ